MSDDLDFDRLPTDGKGWRDLADKLAEIGDTYERHFLEMKGDVDLNAKSSWAKIAKFILGTANRNPSYARRNYGGYALMVLGVGKGAVGGVPDFEVKDIVTYVGKMTGSPGPGWYHKTVPLENGKHLVFIIVDPPVVGKRPWLCREDGDGLTKAEIYFRPEGETRKASPPEGVEMIEEAKASRPKTELDVKVIGAACSYRCDDEILETYIERISEELLDAYPKPKPPAATAGPFSLAEYAGAHMVLGDFARAMTTPDPRSESQYKAEIAVWGSECRKAWPKMLRKLAAVVVSGISIKVVNLSTTFLEGVELKLHIEGDVIGQKKNTTRNFSPIAHLPKPPSKWGPTASKFLTRSPIIPFIPPPTKIDFSMPDGNVTFKNGGSVDLFLPLNELRPEDEYTSPDDQIILVVPVGTEATELHGTWRGTAKGHHEVYKGTFTVEVESRGTRDFSAGVRKSLSKK